MLVEARIDHMKMQLQEMSRFWYDDRLGRFQNVKRQAIRQFRTQSTMDVANAGILWRYRELSLSLSMSLKAYMMSSGVFRNDNLPYSQPEFSIRLNRDGVKFFFRETRMGKENVCNSCSGAEEDTPLQCALINYKLDNLLSHHLNLY